MNTSLSNVEREFILKSARDGRMVVRVQGLGKAIRCYVTEYSKASITLEGEKAFAKPFVNMEAVTAYVDFRGQPISFSSRVNKAENQRIVVLQPEKMVRTLKRAFPRVLGPRGLSVAFSLANERWKLDYPTCGEYTDVALPSELKNDFNLDSLHTLLESFKQKALSVANETGSVIFKGRSPITLEESVLVRYAKTVYIPSTKGGLPKADPWPEGRLVTLAMEEDWEGPAYFTEGPKLSKRLQALEADGIHSLILAPILYYQYVVGYVRMANTHERTLSLDLDAVDLAHEFSRVLAFYLQKHDYFKPSENLSPQRYAGRVVDLSLTGLLVEIPTGDLSFRLKPDSVLALSMEFKSKKRSCKAKVVRSYPVKGGACYGLIFVDLQDEDRAELHEFLYAKAYDDAVAGESSVAFG